MTIDEKVEAMARVIYESTEPLLKPNFWDDWTLTDFAKADLHTRHAHHTMARAVLAALRPGSTGESDGWQPIETAPKDGTEILLYGPGVLLSDGRTSMYARAQHVGWAHEVDGHLEWATRDPSVTCRPTAWRPLPEPPRAGATSSKMELVQPVPRDIPDGFVLVPVEPTEAMMEAAIAVVEKPCFPQDIYRAMLAAAGGRDE